MELHIDEGKGQEWNIGVAAADDYLRLLSISLPTKVIRNTDDFGGFLIKLPKSFSGNIFESLTSTNI